MRRKTVSGIMLSLLLTGMLILTFNIQQVKASGTIYIRADGSIEGTTDIMTVDNITYTFTDNINDEIVIQRDNIVVDGAGYTVQGTGSGIGIYLSGRSNVTIKNMEITTFYRGIRLYESSNNTISGNNVTNSDDGISLDKSPSNTISGNTVTNNDYYGIDLWISSSNILRDNNIANNTYNFRAGGVNDVDTSNTVDGKPIYYWINERDKIVPLDAGYVALVNCTNITVQNLNLTKNGQGILLASTTNSTITKNNVTNNEIGMSIGGSNNTISGNNVTENNRYGMSIGGSNNTISGNILTHNYRAIEPAGYRNIVCNNLVNNNGYGFCLLGGLDNTIASNTIINNFDGICFLFGEVIDLTITNNIIANNAGGISTLFGWGNSLIYHNDFIDNSDQVYIDNWYDFTFVWDDGYPSGGNYWSDYPGEDMFSGPCQNETGSDGIGDTPYVIETNNTDHYPLMYPWVAPPPSYNLTIHSSPTGVTFTVDGAPHTTPWSQAYSENSSVSLIMPETHDECVWSHWLEDGDTNRTKTVTMNANITLTGVFFHIADLNLDGRVDMRDISLAAAAFGSYPGDPRWNPIADVNEDNKVDMRDIATIARNFGKTV